MEKLIDINQSQRLFIELGTPLHLEPNDPQLCVSSQLIGMKVGKYLIVHLSANNWKKSCLKKEDTLLVKYICSDDVFGFNTRVLNIIEEPDSLVFLDYPNHVESCNIRSQARVECFLPVEVVLENDICRKGAIVNINQKGCLCLANDLPFQNVSRNRRISLRFPYGQFDILSLVAIVKSLRRDGEKMSLGLMFEDIDPYSKKVLSTLVPALKI